MANQLTKVEWEESQEGHWQLFRNGYYLEIERAEFDYVATIKERPGYVKPGCIHHAPTFGDAAGWAIALTSTTKEG